MPSPNIWRLGWIWNPMKGCQTRLHGIVSGCIPLPGEDRHQASFRSISPVNPKRSKETNQIQARHSGLRAVWFVLLGFPGAFQPFELRISWRSWIPAKHSQCILSGCSSITISRKASSAVQLREIGRMFLDRVWILVRRPPTNYH